MLQEGETFQKEHMTEMGEECGGIHSSGMATSAARNCFE